MIGYTFDGALIGRPRD